MVRVLLSCFVLLMAEFATGRTLVAQGAASASTRTLAWLTAGIGAGGAGGGGFAVAGSFDVLARQHLVSLRASGVAVEFGNEFWDAGLLYGRAHRNKRAMLTLAVGVALVDGERCGLSFGSNCTQVPATVGLPVSLSASWHLSSTLGLGATAFGDVNHEQSFAGITLNIQVGRLR